MPYQGWADIFSCFPEKVNTAPDSIICADNFWRCQGKLLPLKKVVSECVRNGEQMKFQVNIYYWEGLQCLRPMRIVNVFSCTDTRIDKGPFHPSFPLLVFIEWFLSSSLSWIYYWFTACLSFYFFDIYEYFQRVEITKTKKQTTKQNPLILSLLLGLWNLVFPPSLTLLSHMMKTYLKHCPQ